MYNRNIRTISGLRIGMIVLRCLLASNVCLSFAYGGDDGSHVMRLAIIASDEHRGLSDLLTVSFGACPGIQLLERNDVIKIFNEQARAADGEKGAATIRMGKLLAADAILLLNTEVRLDGKSFLRVKLVAVSSGLVLDSLAVKMPATDIPGFCSLLTDDVKLQAPRVLIPFEQTIFLSVPKLKSSIATKNTSRVESTINGLLVERLMHEPGVVVLERQQAGEMQLDRELSTTDSNRMWTGHFLVEGTIDEAVNGADSLGLSLSVCKSGSTASEKMTFTGSVAGMAAMVNDAARGVIAALPRVPPLKTWDSKAESDFYLHRAQWLQVVGALEDAVAAADAAIALGSSFQELHWIRAICLLNLVSEKVGPMAKPPCADWREDDQRYKDWWVQIHQEGLQMTRDILLYVHDLSSNPEFRDAGEWFQLFSPINGAIFMSCGRSFMSPLQSKDASGGLISEVFKLAYDVRAAFVDPSEISRDAFIGSIKGFSRTNNIFPDAKSILSSCDAILAGSGDTARWSLWRELACVASPVPAHRLPGFQAELSRRESIASSAEERLVWLLLQLHLEDRPRERTMLFQKAMDAIWEMRVYFVTEGYPWWVNELCQSLVTKGGFPENKAVNERFERFFAFISSGKVSTDDKKHTALTVSTFWNCLRADIKPSATSSVKFCRYVWSQDQLWILGDYASDTQGSGGIYILGINPRDWSVQVIQIPEEIVGINASCNGLFVTRNKIFYVSRENGHEGTLIYDFDSKHWSKDGSFTPSFYSTALYAAGHVIVPVTFNDRVGGLVDMDTMTGTNYLIASALRNPPQSPLDKPGLFYFLDGCNTNGDVRIVPQNYIKEEYETPLHYNVLKRIWTSAPGAAPSWALGLPSNPKNVFRPVPPDQPDFLSAETVVNYSNGCINITMPSEPKTVEIPLAFIPPHYKPGFSVISHYSQPEGTGVYDKTFGGPMFLTPYGVIIPHTLGFYFIPRDDLERFIKEVR